MPHHGPVADASSTDCSGPGCPSLARPANDSVPCVYMTLTSPGPTPGRCCRVRTSNAQPRHSLARRASFEVALFSTSKPCFSWKKSILTTRMGLFLMPEIDRKCRFPWKNSRKKAQLQNARARDVSASCRQDTALVRLRRHGPARSHPSALHPDRRSSGGSQRKTLAHVEILARAHDLRSYISPRSSIA
jgi:hypothetical protein